ncbi:MAG: riboflavin synthase [Actinomycetota bacterium]
MFTGIIETSGEVLAIDVREDGARLQIGAPSIAAEARLGDSVAVNGVCLTVVDHQNDALAFDAVNETLSRTNLGALEPGHRVNLERPLRATGRFDGHIVQGHVDGVARLVFVIEEGNARRLRFEVPAELARYVVAKGSVALDGVSLTVAGAGEDWLEVVIIPHTWEVTSLGFKNPGESVNVEVDVLAKYVERLLLKRPASG